MIKKIKNYILTLFYHLCYGLKNADNEIMTSKASVNSNINVQEQITQQNIGEDLLNSVVTQEVKDLRYSTYKVYNESKQYEYIGEGEAIKKESKKNVHKISFIQNNRNFCDGVYESLFGDSDELDKFTLNIGYNYVSRFRVERFIESFQIEIENNICHVHFRFNYDYDLSSPITKMFYNELSELCNSSNKNNTISDNVSCVGFTTYKAQGEDDFIMYIINNLKYDKVEKFDTYVIVSFISLDFMRTDLTEKFYSKEQEKKYQTKENKQTNHTFKVQSVNTVYKCSECGEEMNQYDYEVTKYDLGKSLCIKCLEKYLTNNKE